MNLHDTHVHSLVVSQQSLVQENVRHDQTGGVSHNNREEGFMPAFLDTETGRIYRSCFQDGHPAPMHMLAGLPDELMAQDFQSDCDRSIKSSVVSGFLRNKIFYSRSQAAAAVASRPQLN